MTTDMDPCIRLLGDISVGGPDGAQVDLGHQRQQCVLAVLLVEVNRAVPASALLDRAWGDRQPRQPLDTLYSYVSRLRRALAASGAVLTRSRGGYVINVDPKAVDMHAFDDLVRRARGESDDRQALALLDRALGLWAGDALGCLDTPWLNEVRHDLHRRRDAAGRERDELAIRLGGHEVVLDDLLVRADRDPLDEHLAGLVLLGLYRCGRRAEALDRYERLRRRLAEELGTDPGEPLRRLHQQMLRAEPALAAPAAPVEAAHRTVPHQLPARPASFTGRTRELAELAGAMQPAPGMAARVVISGPGGIGKTWFALHWAHSHQDRYPDGQLYVNLRGFDPAGPPLEPDAVIQSFLAALGISAAALPADPDSRAALFRSLTVDRRLLVLLDNARDSAQVVPLLPGSPECGVLVTSRHRLTGLVATHGARSVSLDVMTDGEAVDVLRTRLGSAVTADSDAVTGLVRHCAGLPLALGIVAARAAAEGPGGLASLAAELHDRRTRLDALDTGDVGVSLRAALTSSVRTVSAPAARLLGYLGLAPGPDIGLPAAASAAGTGPDATRPVLRELITANLLTEDPPRRYRMHDLVRLYAAELTPPPDRPAALTRLLDHYLYTALVADRLLWPVQDPLELPPPRPEIRVPEFADRPEALDWFAVEYHCLLAAARLAAAGGFDRHAWQLAWLCVDQLDQRGHWQDQVAVFQTALVCARRLADDTALGYAHRGLARGYTWLGRFEEARAHLRQAQDAHQRAGDDAGRAFVYRSLARVSARQGRPAQAIADDLRALDLFERVGNDHGRGQALNALGWHHAHLGDRERAVGYCQRAIAIQRRIGDHGGEAMTWDSMAFAWYRDGCYEQAVTGYEQAARLLREQGDSYWEAVITDHLGDAYAAQQRRSDAEDAWARAADQLAALGHPDAGQVRAKLGRSGHARKPAGSCQVAPPSSVPAASRRETGTERRTDEQRRAVHA
jgi:DNA-binding SARP family transcriptional activator